MPRSERAATSSYPEPHAYYSLHRPVYFVPSCYKTVKIKKMAKKPFSLNGEYQLILHAIHSVIYIRGLEL